MIQVKNAAQIAMMRDAGKITGEALAMAGEMVRPGITTKEIDTAIREYITKSGATPSFLNYGGFPASACISINDEVIPGIPSKKKILRDGDIVKIDVGAYYKGYHGDSANTFPVGNVSEEAMTLIRVTKESFLRGIETIGPGSRLGDLVQPLTVMSDSSDSLLYESLSDTVSDAICMKRRMFPIMGSPDADSGSTPAWLSPWNP